MRILYVGNAQGTNNADKFYLSPQRITNGLTRIGHNVYIFHDRDIARYFAPFHSSKLGAPRMNRELIRTCRVFAPDLIMLAHCSLVKNETITEIRAMLPDCRIIHRNVDPLSDAGNVCRIKERMGIIDGIFVTTAGSSLQQFATNKTFAAFFPNPVDKAIDTGRAFEQPDDCYYSDVFFAASSLGKGDHRRVMMEELLRRTKETGLNLKIVGAGLNDKKLFGLPFMDELAHSKSGLIVNKTEGEYLYASDRMSQYLGNGLMVYASAEPRYTDLFTDQELVTYEGIGDLTDKMQFYHKNDALRRTIAENGYKKAHRIFDCELVAQYFIDMAFNRMENKSYPWPTEKYTDPAN